MFVGAEGLRIDNDAAFRAAERQVHDGTLPSHPHREADAFLGAHTGVVAEPTFVWTAYVVVLGTVPVVYRDGAVVALDRHRYLDHARRVGESLDHAVSDVDVLGSRLQLAACGLQGGLGLAVGGGRGLGGGVWAIGHSSGVARLRMVVPQSGHAPGWVSEVVVSPQM